MKTFRVLFNDDMARAIVSGRKTVARRAVMPFRTGDGVDVARIDGRTAYLSNDDDGDIFVMPLPCAPGDILIGRECWGYRGAHCCSEDGFKAQTRLIAYRADGARASIRRDDGRGLPKQRAQRDDEADDDYSTYLSQRWQAWTPSIHMPDWAARIRRRVVSVTVERLQDIGEADAVREGVAPLFTQREVETVVGLEIYRSKPMPWANYLWHGHRGLTRAQVGGWPHQFSGYASARDSFSSLWHRDHAAKGLGWDVNPWVWRIEFERENVQEVSNGR